MYLLRKLSIRDVGNALVRREFALALRITHNLGSNAVNAVRFNLGKRSVPLSRKLAGRKS